MKKIVLFILFLIPICEGGIWLGGGWREDTLSWDIAGPKGHPNILSELEWKEIRMAQVSIGYADQFFEKFFIRIYADYAKVYSGKNIDSDYAGNNRSFLFSRSSNRANKGEAFDWSIGLGRSFSLPCTSFSFTPLIGYAEMHQHFTMRKGFQTHDPIYNYVGPIPGLHSNYRARWINGWIGIDASYSRELPFLLFGALEYHIGGYQGKGHWNLRSDFADDFRHCGMAQGFSIDLGGLYPIGNQFSVGLLANYRAMFLKNGTDQTFFYDDLDGSVLSGKLRLNRVQWHSFRIEAILGYGF